MKHEDIELLLSTVLLAIVGAIFAVLATQSMAAQAGGMGYYDGTPNIVFESGVLDHNTLTIDGRTLTGTHAHVRINLIGAYTGCDPFYAEMGPTSQCWSDFMGTVQYGNALPIAFSDVYPGATNRMDAQLHANGYFDAWFQRDGHYTGDIAGMTHPPRVPLPGVALLLVGAGWALRRMLRQSDGRTA